MRVCTRRKKRVGGLQEEWKPVKVVGHDLNLNSKKREGTGETGRSLQTSTQQMGNGIDSATLCLRVSRSSRTFLLGALAAFDVFAADAPFDRKQDVIYGRKFGMALTMDVFQPKEKANGLGVIFVVSGGWFSGHDANGHMPRFKFLLDRGYTVFSVVHGSQPKFSIPEIP
jgi:hypothetical protein